MKPFIRRAPTIIVLTAASLCFGVSSARSAPALLGVGQLPGNGTDLSGRTETLEDGTPQNRLGALGSGIAYTGSGTLYAAVPDRGPADGTTHFLDRYDLLRIDISPTATVTPTLVQTTLLTNEKGENFTGFAGAFDATNSPASLRLDPEGIRVAKNGNLFISDEYGPFLYEFTPDGKRVRALPVPAKFLISHPSALASDELPSTNGSGGNTSGRQTNRGMEGLALAPTSGKLYGIMQSPLIQDGALDSANKRKGTNNRILEVDPTTGATREFLYPMEAASNGVNEILAINDTEFLVIERDGNAGTAAAFKKIFKISLAGASDISAVDKLPQTGVPTGVTPVIKSLFIDLLDPQYKLVGATFPEKIEGLAFGPDLPDGRHLLVVTNDNDLSADIPNYFFAFAINPAELPNLQK
jgi:hypothetical protein